MIENMTPEELAEAWVDARGMSLGEAGFLEWLNETKAEAWLEGAESAYYDVEIRGFVDYPENPYREGSNG